MIKKFMIRIILVLLTFVFLISAFWMGDHFIIRTDKETFTAKKEKFGYEKIYVDVRSWKIKEYLENPEISSILVDRGYDNMLDTLKQADIKKNTEQILNKAQDVLKELTAPKK